MIRCERATAEHARAIGPHVEVFACAKATRDRLRENAPALVEGHVAGSTEAWAFLLGDEVLAIAGVLPRNIVAQMGAVWLVTRPEAHRHKRAFWRFSKAVVDYLAHEYLRIDGHVDADFTTARRWLARLGFTILDQPYDFDGRKMLPFVMER